MTMQLVIGNKRYSSWSLRAALALELTEEPYAEVLIRLREADTRARILAYSPTGKVPLLITEDGPVWDSLAIAEYLAETYPQAHLWPRGEYARAVARSDTACSSNRSASVSSEAMRSAGVLGTSEATMGLQLWQSTADFANARSVCGDRGVQKVRAI